MAELLEWDVDAQDKDTSRPMFHFKSEKDAAASLEQGRPIFKQVEYVEIHSPGDKTNIPDKRVTDEHRRRWPRHYALFMQGHKRQVVGTPLINLPGVNEATVEEMAYFHVHTVEDLATLSDANAKSAGSVLKLRQQARDYIEAGSKRAPIQKMRAELEQRDSQLEALKRQLAEQAADIQKLHEAQK